MIGCQNSFEVDEGLFYRDLVAEWTFAGTRSVSLASFEKPDSSIRDLGLTADLDQAASEAQGSQVGDCDS